MRYEKLEDGKETISLTGVVGEPREHLKQQVLVNQLQIVTSSTSETFIPTSSDDDSDDGNGSLVEVFSETQFEPVPETLIELPDIFKIDLFNDIRFKKRVLLLCVKWDASSCWLDAMCALFGLSMASQQYPRLSEIAVSRFQASMRRGSFAAGAYVTLVDFATSWIALAARSREFYTKFAHFEEALALLSRARWTVRDALRPVAYQQRLTYDGIADCSAQDPQTFLYGMFEYLPYITGGQMQLVEGCGRTGCARKVDGCTFTFAHQNHASTVENPCTASSLEEALNSALIQNAIESSSTCSCEQGNATSRYYEISELPELLFLSTVDIDTSNWDSTPRAVDVRYKSNRNSTESAEYSWAGCLCLYKEHIRLYWRSGKDNEIIEYDSEKSPWMKLISCSEGTDLDNKLLHKWRQAVTFQVLVRKGGSCVEVPDICGMDEELWMNDLGQHEEGFGTFTNKAAPMVAEDW